MKLSQKKSVVFIMMLGVMLLLVAACGAAQNDASPEPETQPAAVEEGAVVEEAAVEAPAVEQAAAESGAEASQENGAVDAPAEPVEPEQAEPDAATEAGSDKPLLSEKDTQAMDIERSPEVPELPFEDNPDPALCGIPQQWASDEPAYLTGLYEGELIQPVVFLYDSHLRREVVGKAPHGAKVEIQLSQSNPTLDYFRVKVIDGDEAADGWVPAPFVSFEPPPAAETVDASAESAPDLAAPAPSGKRLQPQLAQADIDLDQVEALLPPDAIRAIDPEEVSEIMVPAAKADAAGLSPSARVIGVSIEGESHAYPLPFMSRHEIVNTELGGRKIATTW